MIRSKLFTTAFLVASALLGASCSKTIDVAEERRSTNEAEFRAFADSTGFERVTIPGITGTSFVYMKVTKAGDPNVPVDYTDNVHLFRDTYLTSDWRKENWNARRIHQTLGTNAVTPEAVGSLKIGLQIAVQNLHEGAEATVVIPWYLNNLNTTTERTEAYTSLYVRLHLAKVIKPTTH